MASMSEFLSGFSRYGQSVVQSGSIDPNAKREGLPEIGTFGLGGGPKKVGAIGAAIGSLFGSGQSNQDQMSTDEALGMIGSHFGLTAGGGMPQKYGMHGGQLTLDPNDFVFSGPEMFARLLQQSEMDGGYLSDISQNAGFAGQTRGIMGMMASQDRDRMRAASAANLDPIFAERQSINAQYEQLGGLLGARAAGRAELTERQFEAQQAFTNMMAENEVAEKEFRVNTMANLAGAQWGAEGAIAGGKAAGRGAKMGGLMAGIGAAIGGI